MVGPRKLGRLVARFAVEEDGPTAAEYAVLLAGIVLVAVAAIRGIGERMLNVYVEIDQAIPQG